MEKTIPATGVFIVKKGLNLITKLAASKGELKFTRAAVGTGKPPEGYSPDSMIGLNAYKMDAEIADYGLQDEMAYITVQVSSTNVEDGFLVNEVGVYAQDPDEGEILYGYMDISSDPTYIYANGSANRTKFAEFTLYVLIGNVANVTAAITPKSIITRDTFTAANMKAVDSYGIIDGTSGSETNGQTLFDALVDKVLTEFVTNDALTERLGKYILRSKIVNDFLATDPETVLSGPMGKSLKDQLDTLSQKIVNDYVTNPTLTAKLGEYILRKKIVNDFLATDTETVLSGPMGKQLKNQLDTLSQKIANDYVTNPTLTAKLGEYILKSKIVNNFLATDAGTVLSGPMGKSLKDQLDVLNTKLNGKLSVQSRFKYLYLGEVNNSITFNLDDTEYTIPRMGSNYCIRNMEVTSDLKKIRLSVCADSKFYERFIPLE